MVEERRAERKCTSFYDGLGAAAAVLISNRNIAKEAKLGDSSDA